VSSHTFVVCSDFGADTAYGNDIPFANALAGLPFFNRDGVTERISAYRSHTSDPLAFTNGGRLVWRVGEGHQPMSVESGSLPLLRGQARAPRIFTKCGNQYPTPPPSPAPDTDMAENHQLQRAVQGAPPRQISAVNISSYGWIYVW
jgi:hypothetical protein